MRNACDLGSGACGLLPDDGKACDDGNACTTADTCALGACKPGAATCSCQSDADCAGKDDGNPCNGTLWCAPTTKTCATKPGSAIACGDDGNPCTAAVCDPKGGSCAHLPVEGIACDDDNSCTSDDHCKAGACAGGKTTCPCQTNADCANVPTDKCASVLLCDAIAKTCVPTPASKKKCPPDATSCTKTSCDPKTGQCVSKVLQGPCDDGDPCTQGDHCLGGGCEPGALACSCNADADCAPLDNADLCDAKLTC